MNKTGIVFGALGACLVVALVVGFAGAAVTGPHGFGKTSRNETASGPDHTVPATIIDRLEKQGVDVSAARTAIRNNDTAALKSWLDAYRTANPGNQTGRENRPDPSDIIDRLEKQGVDVSVARTAIRNDDTAALKLWLDTYRTANPGNQTVNRNRPDQSKILDLLEKKGVNITAARTAFRNGDHNALKTMFDEFRAAHNELARGNKTGGSSS